MLDFKRLMFDKNLSQKKLGEIMGTDQPSVSGIINGRRDLRPRHIKGLVAEFGADEIAKYEISDEEFYRQLSRPAQVTFFPSQVVEEVRAEVREELREEMAHPKREDVEVIDAEEVELKVTPILTPEIVNQPGIDIKQGLEDGTLPVQFKPTQDIVPDGVVKVYLENDEMAPDIEANDPVLIRLMDDKNAIVHGRMYFVDLYRGAVVRWVFPQYDGTLLLKSKNAPDMIVQPESVKSISEVVTIWKRPKCLPTDHVSMFEELRRRDDQMDELLAQQGRLIGIIEKQK